MTFHPTLKRWVTLLGLLPALLVIPSHLGGAVSSSDVSVAIDEFFFRVEQLEFAQYLARAAVLSGQPEDYAAHCQEIIRILTQPPSVDADTTFVSGVGLIEWAKHASDDPALLSAVRPSIQVSYLYSQLLVQGYLELALSECELANEPEQAVADIELHLKRTYAFLTTALGTKDSATTSDGLRAAEDILPQEVLFLEPGDSIQEAVDRLADGGAIFLKPGGYQDQHVILTRSIWLARLPGTSSRVRISGGHAGDPVFLATGETGDIEFSDLTITEGSSAIRSEAHASCWVSNCYLIENDSAGVEVAENSSMTITDCQVRGNRVYGVIVSDEARVSLACSDISLNVFINLLSIGAGLVAGDHTTVTVRDCVMIGNSGYGVILTGNAALSATNLNISYSQHGGLHLQQASQAYLSACRIGVNGHWDISTYNADCYVNHNDDWQSEKAFTGSLSGIDNTSQTAGKQPSVCLGSLSLPEGFFADTN
ncbi:right-handed parallel beta-helix repeat-containing protein [Candidatus Bipolaricaulota bacterium]|nr:right-handed parallel beta-helix repeat-containing protein [Candidatus Bipolaricaulota bacterium]